MFSGTGIGLIKLMVNTNQFVSEWSIVSERVNDFQTRYIIVGKYISQ